MEFRVKINDAKKYLFYCGKNDGRAGNCKCPATYRYQSIVSTDWYQ